MAKSRIVAVSGVAVVALVAILVGYGWVRQTLAYVPPSLSEMRPPRTHGVSPESYGLIQTGMSYDEVVQIIGADGVELSHVLLGNVRTQLFQWRAESGVLHVTFQNNRVVMKAQAR